MGQTHYEEMACKTPLDRAVYEATKNVVVWLDVPGAAVMDIQKTAAAKREIEDRIRREWAERGAVL